MTTHCIRRDVTAVFYKFAIIRCPISQLYIKLVCEQYLNHVQASEVNGEGIDGYKRKGLKLRKQQLLFYFSTGEPKIL